MSDKRYDKNIEELRKVVGTLPSEEPIKKTEIVLFKDSIEVTLEDANINPYKAMFVTGTSTWGDNEFKQKWPETIPENRLEVVKAVLTNNALPQAREMINFIFRVKGIPRWLFDLHVRVPFASFMSIGCRDNNKLDADIVMTDKLVDTEIYDELKDIYEEIVKSDRGTWQSARAFLPQNYSHSYHFGQNLLSIYNTRILGDNDLEKDAFILLYYNITEVVRASYPLIGFYLQTVLYEGKDKKEIKEKVFQNIRDLKYEELMENDKLFFEA